MLSQIWSYRVGVVYGYTDLGKWLVKRTFDPALVHVYLPLYPTQLLRQCAGEHSWAFTPSQQPLLPMQSPRKYPHTS